MYFDSNVNGNKDDKILGGDYWVKTSCVSKYWTKNFPLLQYKILKTPVFEAYVSQISMQIRLILRTELHSSINYDSKLQFGKIKTFRQIDWFMYVE